MKKVLLLLVLCQWLMPAFGQAIWTTVSATGFASSWYPSAPYLSTVGTNGVWMLAVTPVMMKSNTASVSRTSDDGATWEQQSVASTYLNNGTDATDLSAVSNLEAWLLTADKSVASVPLLR